jgi:sortase A
VPDDTYMTLTVPAMGISDVPVVEGTTEASLSQGAGHYTGSGYPWVAGSNTYIAGHRIGYPGTPSDHVFWNLPNLAMGDKIYLTDSNGHTYIYAVSDILEVPINDLSVTGPTGSDTVSLQTCIEDYGDYWTPGPNWNVRYIVRGTLV